VLGCWCAPLPCHGNVLARLVNTAGAPQRVPEEATVDEFHIVQEGPSEYRHQLDIDEAFVPVIVGKDATVLKAIERDTGCKLEVSADRVLGTHEYGVCVLTNLRWLFEDQREQR